MSRIDLNLLVVFGAMMETRNTTRAAEKLFVTQPAVSHGLRRLRGLLKDDLFVRNGRGLVPTVRAEAMWRELAPLLSRMEQVVGEEPAFVPAETQRVFRIGLPSSLDVCLTPRLLKVFTKTAPHANLVVRPTSYKEIARQLDEGEVELGLSYFDELRPWHIRESLGTRGYLCLYDGRRLGIPAPITLKRFLALPHVLVSFTGDRTGVVDAALERRRLKRRVLVAGPDFASAAMYLKCTEALAVLPEDAAKTFSALLGLTCSPVPVDVRRFELSMAWHKRNQNDGGHRWFRNLVAEMAAVD